MNKRMVITGLGVVAPTGIGTEEHWKTSLAGESRITPLQHASHTDHRIQVAGQIPDFDPDQYVENRQAVQTDRGTWFAFAAAQMALEDSRFDLAATDPALLSVVTSSASGGNAFGQREIQALWSQGPRAVSAYQAIGWFYAATTGQLSIRHQMKGHCSVVVSGGTGGIDAIAQAGRLIRRGSAAVLVGGTEAPLSPYALACQAGLPQTSPGADPLTAYRPFDADASGYVPGEGGAMLLVEELGAARARGADLFYAEIAGTASTHDGHHHTRAVAEPTQLARAVREALARAKVRPDEVDVVFADAAGDRERDALEVAAIKQVFGSAADQIPVTAPKSMTGRLYAGAAAIDTATAALTLHYGTIPPTVNLHPASAGHGLDFVTEARTPPRLHTALVIARDASGGNAALVLRAAPPLREER
jgi:minimal PKS chain-length factor (CLF/KS beta)